MASSSNAAGIHSLGRLLERSATIQDKADLFRSFLDDEVKNDSGTHISGTLLPGYQNESDPLRDRASERKQRDIQQLVEKHGLRETYLDWATEHASLDMDDNKPLSRLPCANVDAPKNWKCPDDGTLACSGCRLVSYCSKVSKLSNCIRGN
jgi:hypothetical protein